MSTQYRDIQTPDFSQVAKLAPLIIIGAAVAVLAVGSWFIIQPGSVGLVIRTGNLNRSVGEGLHFKLPLFEDIVRMETRVQKEEVKASAFSQDLQTVETVVVVNFRISVDAAVSVFRNLGRQYYDRVIHPATQEAIKAITAKYTAENLVKNRDKVRNEIKDELTIRLKASEVDLIDFAITDFDFSKEFNRAIEEKQIAEQRVFTAANDLKRIQQEAEQKIATARAEATSLGLQRQAVSAELIELRRVEAQLKAIEKWNGVLPTYTGGHVIPFIGGTSGGAGKTG